MYKHVLIAMAEACGVRAEGVHVKDQYPAEGIIATATKAAKNHLRIILGELHDMTWCRRSAQKVRSKR